MRRLTLILISLAILSQTLNSVIIFAGYSLNKEYITKTYCINKDKPKLHCNGKCHLMKDLKDQEQKESTPLNSLKEKMEMVVYFSLNSSFLFSDNNLVEQISTPYFERMLANFYNQPFQPPRS